MASNPGGMDAGTLTKSAAQPELTAEMRKATRVAHKVITDLFVAPKILAVLTDRELYAQALGSFLPVYAALERLLKQHRDVPCLVPIAKVLLDGGLERSAAIEHDLAVLLGPQWRSRLPPSKATQRYVQHLEQVAQREPALLVPYAFACYITVLIGILARQVRTALNIHDNDEGVEFVTVKDRAAKRNALRAAVNEAGTIMDPATRRQVVKESVQPFMLNAAVVSEFNVGPRVMLRAVRAGLAALPKWALVVLLSVLVALVSLLWAVFAALAR